GTAARSGATSGAPCFCWFVPLSSVAPSSGSAVGRSASEDPSAPSPSASSASEDPSVPSPSVSSASADSSASSTGPVSSVSDTPLDDASSSVVVPSLPACAPACLPACAPAWSSSGAASATVTCAGFRSVPASSSVICAVATGCSPGVTYPSGASVCTQ